MLMRMTCGPKSFPTVSLALALPDQVARRSRSLVLGVDCTAAVPSNTEQAPSLPIQSRAPERLLTVSEAAGLLAVSEKTIRRWIAAGRLPAVRLGRLVRVLSKSLNELIQLNEDDSHE